jgi:transcription elongation factor Elf1
MAINMLHEQEEITCPLCKNNTFIETPVFQLKWTKTPEGMKVKKIAAGTKIHCFECGIEIEKDFQIL